MAGTRLTDENKALNTSNTQSSHRRRVFGRYFGTVAVAIATAVTTLGGNIMAHARPPPVEVKTEHREIVTARTVLEQNTRGINQFFTNQKSADMDAVAYGQNPLVQQLLTNLIEQNSRLKGLNNGQDVFPISGKTPDEQFTSLNTWLGGSGPLTPERLQILQQKISEAFGQVNATITTNEVVPEPVAIPITPRKTEVPERRPLDRTVPQLRPVFDEMEFTSLISDLRLISFYPKRENLKDQASSYVTRLEELNNGGKPTKIADLNGLYKEARKFASGRTYTYAVDENQKHLAAARVVDSLKETAITSPNQVARLAAVEKLNDQNALADVAYSSKHQETREAAIAKITDKQLLTRLLNIAPHDDKAKIQARLAELTRAAEPKIAREPAPATRIAEPEIAPERIEAPVVATDQAYLQTMAQKSVELAQIALDSLLASPVPDKRRQKEAWQKSAAAITIAREFVVYCQGFTTRTDNNFDQLNRTYEQALLRADTAQTMGVLLKFAKENGMDNANPKFFIAYTDLIETLASTGLDYREFDEKLGGFYVEVSKLAPEMEFVSEPITALATLRASRDSFYAEYLRTVGELKNPITLSQSQKMLGHAIEAYSRGKANDDPLLVKAEAWKQNCTDPMTLYAMAHSLVSIREAEVWMYTIPQAKAYPFNVKPEHRTHLENQLNLARNAFLWNFNDDFTGSIRVDQTYYPNMSTTLAEDVTHTLMPTLRFTESFAGFFVSMVGAQDAAQVTRAAVDIERDHVRLLLSMKYPFPSNPWSASANPNGLDIPLAVHHAREFGVGPYAIPGLVSRSTKPKFDSGLPRVVSGRQRLYYLGPVTDLNPDHDAPGYAHNGLGASVLRREAVLVGDSSAPYLLRSDAFNGRLHQLTADFMKNGNSQVAVLSIADIRILELEGRLAATIAGDDVPINELPSKAPDDPRIFYVERAQKALEAARLLRSRAEATENTVTAKLALEVAELGLEGLSDAHLTDIYTPPVAAPVENWTIAKATLDTHRFGGQDHMYATTQVSVTIGAETMSAEEYARKNGQQLQYQWQFYSQYNDGNFYLLNPNYGQSGEPEFLGKVVRNIPFSDGTVGDAVVSVVPSRNTWQVLEANGNPFILYRLQRSSSPDTFIPVEKGVGSIMPLLFTVSTSSNGPTGHMLFNGAEVTRTGVILTKVNKE
ncbi:MAG: hypothetical protein ABID61_01345 [Candidatus Micrarchaeota archaeon]